MPRMPRTSPLTPNRPMSDPCSPMADEASWRNFTGPRGSLPSITLWGFSSVWWRRIPGFPEALFDAFERSKQEAYRRDPAARLILRRKPA